MPTNEFYWDRLCQQMNLL